MIVAREFRLPGIALHRFESLERSALARRVDELERRSSTRPASTSVAIAAARARPCRSRALSRLQTQRAAREAGRARRAERGAGRRRRVFERRLQCARGIVALDGQAHRERARVLDAPPVTQHARETELEGRVQEVASVPARSAASRVPASCRLVRSSRS